MLLVLRVTCFYFTHLRYDIAAELKMDVEKDKEALALFCKDLVQDMDWDMSSQKQAGYARAKLVRYHIDFSDTVTRSRDTDMYTEEVVSATARAGETEPLALMPGQQTKIKVECPEHVTAKFNKGVLMSGEAKLIKTINEAKKLKFDLEAVPESDNAYAA